MVIGAVPRGSRPSSATDAASFARSLTIRLWLAIATRNSRSSLESRASSEEPSPEPSPEPVARSEPRMRAFTYERVSTPPPLGPGQDARGPPGAPPPPPGPPNLRFRRGPDGVATRGSFRSLSDTRPTTTRDSTMPDSVTSGSQRTERLAGDWDDDDDAGCFFLSAGLMGDAEGIGPPNVPPEARLDDDDGAAVDGLGLVDLAGDDDDATGAAVRSRSCHDTADDGLANSADADAATPRATTGLAGDATSTKLGTPPARMPEDARAESSCALARSETITRSLASCARNLCSSQDSSRGLIPPFGPPP